MDDGIADEEPAADQEGDSENSQRFDKNFFCRFPEMNHQREEQQNAAQQVRVGVIVRQRAESAACSKADAVFLAECAFHAADPEVDDQCDEETHAADQRFHDGPGHEGGLFVHAHKALHQPEAGVVEVRAHGGAAGDGSGDAGQIPRAAPAVFSAFRCGSRR